MDALAISAIIVAVTGMIVSTLSVIKHSACCGKCFEIDTRTPVNNTPITTQPPASAPPLGDSRRSRTSVV